MTLQDYALPAELASSLVVDQGRSRAATPVRHAQLTPRLLRRLVQRLATAGGRAIREVGQQRLLDLWTDTVETFLDPASSERRRLDATLAVHCRLSPAGLNAGLEAILEGVARRPATPIFRQATAHDRSSGATPPAWIVLASNLPALAVQPLLPTLACGRPVVLKSPSAEPFFAAQFVRALCARQPLLQEAIAALTWRGGDRELEAPLLAGCEPIVAYGEAATLANLEGRARGRIVGLGPKTSLAIVSQDSDPASVARALARDIALFDQRGCLSVAAVYTDGRASVLAAALAAALSDQAGRLPPGPADLGDAAAVQQLRGEAQMRGLEGHFLALNAGTVLIEPKPDFYPSPGLRTVRIHPVLNLAAIPALLRPWKGRLQGAALAGEAAWQLAPQLRSLAISRCAETGQLQWPDAGWENGMGLELFRQPA